MSEQKILCIGDLHIQPNNVKEMEYFFSFLTKQIKQCEYDLVVFMGDLFHTQKKVDVQCLNVLLKNILTISRHTYVYILVGNHDMIDSTQSVGTTDHSLNFFKLKSPDIVVVDKVLSIELDKNVYYFSPYTHKGNLLKSIQSYDKKTNSNFLDAKCIFCHQEFQGAIMKTGMSKDGDEWDDSYPIVVSGHIHLAQKVSSNIYYTGSSLSISTDKKSMIQLTVSSSVSIQKIHIDVPQKEIIHISDSEIASISDIDRKISSFKLTKPLLFYTFNLNIPREKFNVYKNTPEFKTLESLYNIRLKEVEDEQVIENFSNTKAKRVDFSKYIREKIDNTDQLTLDIYRAVFEE